MKKSITSIILCISWVLNAQVALPTFQGAQMPMYELEDTEWRFTADGANNAGTSYYNSTSGSSSHSWTVPVHVKHITILGISGGGGSASTSISGGGGSYASSSMLSVTMTEGDSGIDYTDVHNGSVIIARQ